MRSYQLLDEGAWNRHLTVGVFYDKRDEAWRRGVDILPIAHLCKKFLMEVLFDALCSDFSEIWTEASQRYESYLGIFTDFLVACGASHEDAEAVPPKSPK